MPSPTPSRQLQVGSTFLSLIRGDITAQNTDAIVNAANASLMGGGGVDGAIHRAGGPKILEECKAIRARQGNLSTGHAVITSGGNLKARHVIHTVGPVWRGGSNREDELLASAYRNSLQLALTHGCKSIAFPSISTGVYGYPIERAARIALNNVREFVTTHPGFQEVRFVVFSERDEAVYRGIFQESEEEDW
jgi:O-acetyl-ADP-ribose deacetylase (regulator of RNase III)